MRTGNDRFFDVDYGKASVALTSTGLTVVSTIEAYYHGISFLASAAAVTVKVFNDSAGTANLVDLLSVAITASGSIDRFNPVVCKNGLTVSITGTGGTGVIFFSQKG